MKPHLSNTIYYRTNRTVKEYVHTDRLPIAKRKSSSSLYKYRDVIIDNIDKSLNKIFDNVKTKDYNGTQSNLKTYICRKNLKVSTIDTNKYVNRQYIIELLHHHSMSIKV